METVSYFAIEASSDLAKERGSYSSYEGSLWSQGIFPIDSISILTIISSYILDFSSKNNEKSNRHINCHPNLQ